MTPSESGWCALLTTGAVDCWGDNTFGQAGNGSTTGPQTCIEGNDNVPCVTTPAQVEGVGGSGTLSHVTALTSDGIGWCALIDSGGLDCWGDNLSGELGDGTTLGPNNCITTHCSAEPVAVKGVGDVGTLSGVTSITAPGLASFCAALNSGGADCWGDNEFADLGIGTTSGPSLCQGFEGENAACALSPKHVVTATGNLAGVTAVAADCALLTAGGVACWGDGVVGQLGNGTKSPTNESDVAVTVLSP
jgi:alpha-tubulin suppressor-like RCC1 family protein